MNRRLVALQFASGLVLLGGATRAPALTPAEVYAAVSPSVWRVVTYDVDGLPLAQGSAVVVGADTLVTNCHVLARSKRVAVRREKVSVDARLEKWDTQRDLCELRAIGLAAPAVRLAPTAGVIVGANVYAIGSPRGLELTMSAGLVSSLRKNASGQVILVQTSASISGGSSGGGLFDDSGALVGLTTIGSVAADTQNLNFAIPADWINDLPERHARLSRKPATALAAASAPSTFAPAPTEDRLAASPTAAPRTVAEVSAPDPETARSRRPDAAGTGAFARIDEVDKLPYASDAMRARYRLFLSQPLPRAFVISDGGASRQASAAGALEPAERALRDCRQAMTGRCFVYAVDDRVVYQPDAKTK